MAEAWKSPVSKAWGCTDCRAGWVPYPKEIPRRNPWVDAVGRTDEPCDRPAHEGPHAVPTPKFKAPREGYPNNMCNIEDYKNGGEAGADEGATMTVTVAPGTPQEICLRPQPLVQTDAYYADPPTLEDCCADGRSLDTLKSEVQKILGPHEELEMGMKNWAQCQSPCQPLLPKYPCRGVIRSPRPDWKKPSEADKCKLSAAVSGSSPADPGMVKQLTGREFVEGMRTCDIYPIHPKLPARFNNAEWFKGYGCENPAHPFYLTTTSEYGRFPPTAHTMTQAYFPKSNKFSDHWGRAGMPRNRSLNLANDKSIV